MATSIPQLRIGVTRNRGFVYRTCVRPPMSVTIGTAREAVCPIDDDEGPDLHPLFEVGGTSCVLEFKRGWTLTMYRDGQAVSGADLIAEGTAILRGNRALLKMAPGSRGALYFGSTRLLFKWEELAGDRPGSVPLRDVGEVPRCHACGQALADALAREGLLARCNSCRAMNRFVDADAPYREDRVGTTTEEEAHGMAWRRAADTDHPKEEADTLIGMPLFAPVTMNLDPLPAYLRPAGVPAEEANPGPGDAMAAASRMRTVLGRSPFLGPRTPRRDIPAGPAGGLVSGAMEIPGASPGPPRGLTAATTATTSPGEPIPAPEILPNTVLMPAMPQLAEGLAEEPAEEPTEPPAPALGPASDPLDAAPSDPPTSFPRARVELPAIRPDGMEIEGSSPTSGFWTAEASAEEPDSVEVPALDRAFYTSEVEALDWGRGASVVPWGTLTALSARNEFQRSAGRIQLGPGEEPPPPSISAAVIAEERATRELWSERVVLVLISALVGAAVAVAVLLGFD